LPESGRSPPPKVPILSYESPWGSGGASWRDFALVFGCGRMRTSVAQGAPLLVLRNGSGATPNPLAPASGTPDCRDGLIATVRPELAGMGWSSDHTCGATFRLRDHQDRPMPLSVTRREHATRFSNIHDPRGGVHGNPSDIIALQLDHASGSGARLHPWLRRTRKRRPKPPSLFHGRKMRECQNSRPLTLRRRVDSAL
jgi:hypothetical protein